MSHIQRYSKRRTFGEGEIPKMILDFGEGGIGDYRAENVGVYAETTQTPMVIRIEVTADAPIDPAARWFEVDAIAFAGGPGGPAPIFTTITNNAYRHVRLRATDAGGADIALAAGQTAYLQLAG